MIWTDVLQAYLVQWSLRSWRGSTSGATNLPSQIHFHVVDVLSTNVVVVVVNQCTIINVIVSLGIERVILC